MPRLGVLWLLLASVPCGGLKALNSTKPCNQDPGLCQLRVDQVTWAGTHNADSAGLKIKMFPLPCLTDNHEHHMVKELDLGLRFFDTDTCLTRSHDLYICHGIAYGRMFLPEMRKIKEWMDAHPREVIILLFGNVNLQQNTPAGKKVMMEKLTGHMLDVFGDMLLVPPMRGGRLKRSWPKLGEMVDQNKRMIILWGQSMYYQIYTEDKKTPGFRDKWLWFDKYWANSYTSAYRTMTTDQLKHSLEHFCDDPDNTKKFKKKQPMVLADGYLTINPSRPLDICNKDLAGEVNPELLEYDHLDTNPLLAMQTNCWANQKQVSLLSMDFTEYFPQRLDRMGRGMNERNFARYGWIGGKMSVSGAQANKTDAELKALLAKLAGLETPDRITVDHHDTPATARRLHGRGRGLAAASGVHFSILAPEEGALTEPSNGELLAKMKEAAANEAGVDGIKAVCRDPGTPSSATRDHAAQSFFEEGTKLVFTCNAPLVAHGSLERTCRPDGLFSGLQPSCLEAWTMQVRLFPDWLKILMALALIICLLGCLCGCLFLCMRKCGKGYSKIESQ